MDSTRAAMLGRLDPANNPGAQNKTEAGWVWTGY